MANFEKLVRRPAGGPELVRGLAARYGRDCNPAAARGAVRGMYRPIQGQVPPLGTRFLTVLRTLILMCP